MNCKLFALIAVFMMVTMVSMTRADESEDTTDESMIDLPTLSPEVIQEICDEVWGVDPPSYFVEDKKRCLENDD